MVELKCLSKGGKGMDTNSYDKFTPEQKVRIIEAVCPVLVAMIMTAGSVLTSGLV